MRLGILTQYYPPEMGAPQARLSNLAGHFIERGHEVYVLTAMPNYPQGRIYPGYGGLVRRERSGDVSVVRSYVYPATGLGSRRLLNYFSFAALLRACGSLHAPPAGLPHHRVAAALPGHLRLPPQPAQAGPLDLQRLRSVAR